MTIEKHRETEKKANDWREKAKKKRESHMKWHLENQQKHKHGSHDQLQSVQSPNVILNDLKQNTQRK